MIYLSTNLKLLREGKGWKQSDLAAKIGVAPNTISNYEKGVSQPDYSTLLKLVELFDSAVDVFLYHNLCDPAYIHNYEVKNRKVGSEIVPVIGQELSLMYVPFVNQYVHAGYLRGFSDDTYLSKLPRIPWIVDKEYKGSYMAFEVKGDSMDDGTKDSYIAGDILLCREISHDLWATSKLHFRKWDFVIAHKTDGIIVKRIIEHKVDKATIKVHSLNDQFHDYDINLKDVLKIFNVVKVERKK